MKQVGLVVSLVFWLLFVISPSLMSYSFALTYHGDGKSALSLKLEGLEDNGAIGLRKSIGFGGRKMLVVSLTKEDDVTDEEFKRTSKVSGEDTQDSKTSISTSQNLVNHQNAAVNMLEHKTSKEEQPIKGSLLKSSTRPKEPEFEEINKGIDDDVDDEETQRLLEEVDNLMRKDYNSMGHRKPPINNHEPSH